ncbi:S28 family serine protease [Spongiactinospora sp. 9N601]|uniref:S28 family serine protease n=1 Tax=Spongiactinospora sp. 9N601 TaxID=3375149 RepID=UPI0037A64DA0
MAFRKAAAAFALLLASMGTVTTAHAESGDIADRLRAVPGMTVTEQPSTLPGRRWFHLRYRQPVDHDRPDGAWFEQRVMLQHRAADRPMVFHTTGHTVPETMFETEPTTVLGANQLSMEYRYYPGSRPVPTDWSKATIRQGAADQHRLVVALKRIYRRKWIGTGGSKGGQASVAHRLYHPGDIDGTVAYVAPNNVDDDEDSAYDRFFQTVGDDPRCRTHVRALAREILERRAAMVGLLTADAAAHGWTFGLVGDIDRAFEHSVMDYEWGFWSYNDQSACASLPELDASDEELYRSFDRVLGFRFFSDQALTPYVSAFYQGAKETGWQTLSFPHLRPLLRYEREYRPGTYVPRDIPITYDGTAVREIDRYVRTRGHRLMFVNGGTDPVSAEPYRLGPGSRDSAVYTAPGVHHVFLGEVIGRLPRPQRDKAIADLRRWAR